MGDLPAGFLYVAIVYRERSLHVFFDSKVRVIFLRTYVYKHRDAKQKYNYKSSYKNFIELFFCNEIWVSKLQKF